MDKMIKRNHQTKNAFKKGVNAYQKKKKEGR